MQGAQRAGQIPAFVSEIARNKSLALALRQVTVKDFNGEVVDLTQFIGSDELDAEALVSEVEAAAEEDEGAPASGDDADEGPADDVDFVASAFSLASPVGSASSAPSADSADSPASPASAPSADSAPSPASADSAE